MEIAKGLLSSELRLGEKHHKIPSETTAAGPGHGSSITPIANVWYLQIRSPRAGTGVAAASAASDGHSSSGQRWSSIRLLWNLLNRSKKHSSSEGLRWIFWEGSKGAEGQNSPDSSRGPMAPSGASPAPALFRGGSWPGPRWPSLEPAGAAAARCLCPGSGTSSPFSSLCTTQLQPPTGPPQFNLSRPLHPQRFLLVLWVRSP